MSKLTTNYKAGDTFTMESKRTNYTPVGGVTPIGYVIGEDGNLWTKPSEREILKVRKTHGAASFDIYLKGGARVTVPAE